MYTKDEKAKLRGTQLLTDESVLNMFKTKFDMIHHLREYLYSVGSIEVEVPYMNKYREGAPVVQYETIDPITKERFFLRHSPENFLRRIGQPFRNIYEIGKNFRVEYEDDFHANEYIVLEHKSVEHSYQQGIDLVVELLKYTMRNTFGSLDTGIVNFENLSIVTFDELMKKNLGFSMHAPNASKLALKALEGIEEPLSKEKYDWEIYELVMKYFIEKKIEEPTIVTDFPVALQHTAVIDREKQISKRFSLIIKGIEVCDGGIKFDNSDEYRAVFEENEDFARRYMGFEHFEVSPEFYTDVDNGHMEMFSFGLGIDRLFALCVGKNIHDVILFPFR